MDASDPEEVEIRRQIVESRLHRDAVEIQELLAMPAFRRFTGNLVYGICGVERSTVQHNAETTYFYEGTRNVGLQILHQLKEVDFQAVLLMQKEREEERKLEALKARPRDEVGLDTAPKVYAPPLDDGPTA